MALVVSKSNFHNDRGVATGHDQINFAAAAAVVSGDQDQAVFFQQLQGLGFGQLPLCQ